MRGIYHHNWLVGDAMEIWSFAKKQMLKETSKNVENNIKHIKNRDI
jgi:hypothetical protein